MLAIHEEDIFSSLFSRSNSRMLTKSLLRAVHGNSNVDYGVASCKAIGRWQDSFSVGVFVPCPFLYSPLSHVSLSSPLRMGLLNAAIERLWAQALLCQRGPGQSTGRKHICLPWRAHETRLHGGGSKFRSFLLEKMWTWGRLPNGGWESNLSHFYKWGVWQIEWHFW